MAGGYSKRRSGIGRRPGAGRAWSEQTSDAGRPGSPAVLVDKTGSASAAVLVLACSAQERRLSGRRSAGGEWVDPVVSGYLRRGFGLVTSMEPSCLSGLPHVPGWHAELAGRTLRVSQRDEVLYTGAIDVDIPLYWYRAAATRGRLVIMVARDWTPPELSPGFLDQQRLAGTLVGAGVRLTHPRS
jgi:hypothetical protein